MSRREGSKDEESEGERHGNDGFSPARFGGKCERGRDEQQVGLQGMISHLNEISIAINFSRRMSGREDDWKAGSGNRWREVGEGGVWAMGRGGVTGGKGHAHSDRKTTMNTQSTHLERASAPNNTNNNIGRLQRNRSKSTDRPCSEHAHTPNKSQK